jgi:hypothetical protein
MGEKNFSLDDFKGKTVKVVPIIRTTGWITDPNHEAAFLVGSATNNYTVPMDRNGNIICPLTPEELAYFETPDARMDLKKGDLSPYKKENNFWQQRKIRLNKAERVLNLGNPKDYIDYRILLANKDLVAPSPKESKRKRTYKYMIVAEDHEVNTRLTRQAKMQEAYMFFGKIESNKEEMTNFLKIYGKRVPLDASAKWLKDELGKMISENIQAFLDIARDENRKVRLLILEAVDAGVITKDGRKYFLQGGEPLASAGEVPLMDAAVKFLKAKKNQDIYLELKARLDTSKD